ncbi:4-(cytidine 5'-diphospho)-2-C-methyl-D-erythritol kinase [Kingella negevensis]|uniref:4-diphosphocytidyl-2-C-methyl-D-erythritol kinase n=2 Tax=Kingella negevensis TaxID=1522312 RepID=A0A238HK14_9NEIS|nr:4-(cytidine 5'-diphospho)-2-C-methyl-D-erythritol kinase [Kingella negevensis]MDK4679816.1 4-(cytidine 5'-diphospho)-2-C-methyl-D-erythritol kinase [Kingella negevensis]MDK4682465.1 4-(cytidine 5'-diphospho)-2-C-methyl-D-erythritol kinase [Kingella negevensis]MDK4684643.1 4-(cytidine 5'-diphospho)-2-C-methyl-D-erythritol kinase [Kingella negevensis]MDK4690662.1 4-(cytidine 5'-diphospho)-2-C-methyl-D-erythritol kinase [Kingella negevensis]MDK4699920.1 4-(cytidine 5'-diphospho)-2-C-methyl-D-e
MQPENIYLSPAKLNLDLRIIGKLPNGYHALESIFTLIDLYDTLKIQPRNDTQIVLHTPTVGVPTEQDLTVRAATLLQHFSGSLKGVDIWIEKRIPMGGGLGGGSSNAATVLLVLNHLWGCGLNQQQLIDIGVMLGADVPFFIFGQTAFARGVGEQLQAIDVPAQHYVLVRPEAHVATPKIFAHPDLPRNSSSNPNPTWVNLQPLRNDMQAVVLQDYPKVQAAFAELAKHGEPRMTGSGACLFLPCESVEQTQEIQKMLSESLQSWCVQAIDKHPLYPLLSNR